jgi:hypothetical protein
MLREKELEMSLFKYASGDKAGQPSTQLSLERDVNPIIKKHYATLLPATHAALSVFATLALKDRTKPVSVIFEAASGFGKTAVLQMAFPPPVSDPSKKSKMHNYMYRSDKFTPRAFVSHAANVKKDELGKIDLLPRLKGKVLITKELAPIFRGRETELQENFGVLISVLDGQGYTSDSGSQGTRGYTEPIIFNWLGATTPLPLRTHRMMSQLGTRILFYDISYVAPTEAEMLAYARNGDAGTAEKECNLAVTRFIINFFNVTPPNSVSPNDIIWPNEIMVQLVKWALFLVKARAEVKYDKSDDNQWEPIAAMPPEGAWKVINYFKEIAIGHALIHDRKEINQSDLDLVAHVAISSVPGQLRPIVKELRKVDSVDSNRGSAVSAVSKTTLKKFFKELELLGIVHIDQGSSKNQQTSSVRLTQDYLWLRG